ncbi:MAG TPA: hypothetical protein VL995_08195 [Cellvibrio sp.]|nr:hypothetical protein [Cellvibrio sp.]
MLTNIPFDSALEYLKKVDEQFSTFREETLSHIKNKDDTDTKNHGFLIKKIAGKSLWEAGRFTHLYLSLLTVKEVQADPLFYIHHSLPDLRSYYEFGLNANKELLKTCPNNDTVRCLLEIYWKQWKAILKFRDFFYDLCRDSLTNALPTKNPLALMEGWRLMLHRYPQLHNAFEKYEWILMIGGLLEHSGFTCKARKRKESASFCIDVKEPGQLCSELIFDFAMYQGGPVMESEKCSVHAAFSNLCGNLRTYDKHAALIIFTEIELIETARLLFSALKNNLLCKDLQVSKVARRLDFSLRANVNTEQWTSASIVFFEINNF